METKNAVPSLEAEATQPQSKNAEPKIKAPMKMAFKSKILTSDFCLTLKNRTEEIISHFSNASSGEIEASHSISALQEDFEKYSARHKLSKQETEEAFEEYVQAIFSLKPSRAYEYIRVSKNKAVCDLKLPISSLVEFSRLSAETIANILKVYDVSQLRLMSYRQIKSLVRKNNNKALPISRASKKQTEKSDSVLSFGKGNQPGPQETALEDFLKAFEKFRAETERYGLHEEFADILSKIIDWHVEKNQPEEPAA